MVKIPDFHCSRSRGGVGVGLGQERVLRGFYKLHGGVAEELKKKKGGSGSMIARLCIDCVLQTVLLHPWSPGFRLLGKYCSIMRFSLWPQ